MEIVRNIVLAAFISIVSGCFSTAGEHSRDEVSRVPSPSGTVEAVLVETNGGATTSFGYDVYVVEAQSQFDADTRVARLYGAVRSNKAYGVNLVWDGDQKLTIQYLDAKKESVFGSPITVGSRTVEIELRKGVEDNLAPPGGMLYNLEGRPYDRDK